MTPRTVGILGGMGPAATLNLMDRMLRLSQGKTEQDGMRMLVDNNPQVPDRNRAIAGTGPSPAPLLVQMAQGLEKSGADFLVMACNSAHAFAPQIARAVTIPFLSMIEEAVLAAAATGAKKLGLLAAAACLDAGLYQTALARKNIAVIAPQGAARETFMALLYAIKAGDTGPSVRAAMAGVARALADQGAACIIAGCTEVPLVLAQEDVALPLIDSTQVLARAAVDIAYGKRGLPALPLK